MKREQNSGSNLEAATLERALMLACDRIADGPQTYEEADTAEGWFEKFVEQAGAADGAGTEKLRM